MTLWFLPALFPATHLNFHAQWALGFLTVALSFAVFPKARRPRALVTFFVWFYYINSCLTIVRGHGILGNGSMDASFIACLFVGLRVSPLPLILTMLSVQAWAPLFVLVSALGWKYPWRTVGVLFSGLAFAWWRGFDSGRFLVWEYTLRFYLCNAPSWLFGLGWGQFREIMPRLQLARGGDPASLFLHAHNDYFQLLFEMGFVGILALFFLMRFAYAHANTPKMKSAWCALFGMAFLNMPLHLFYCCLWGVTLFTISRNETCSNSQC